MDTKLKEAWVVALRSGEYKQGRNYLNDRGNFCCLGVACEVWNKIGAVKLDVTKRDGRTVYNNFKASPPAEVVTLINGFYDEVSRPPTDILITMNDSDGKTFNEIADWIEANL